MSEVGKQLDTDYAKCLSQGKHRKALVLMAQVSVPFGKSAALYKLLFNMVGAFIIPKVSTTYAQDILIEADAEVEA